MPDFPWSHLITKRWLQAGPRMATIPSTALKQDIEVEGPGFSGILWIPSNG